MMRDRVRRFIEAVLPWYDPKAVAEHERATARDRRDAEAARLSAQRLRADYRAYAARLERK